MKSKIVIFFFAFVSIFVVFNEDKLAHNQFTWDKCGYYLYLPAIFIYHDLGQLKFVAELETAYEPPLSMLGVLHPIGDNKLNKYPAGVAVFQLPLFLMAHSYCVLTHQFPANGFSVPYQLACILTNILCVMAGMFMLRRYLQKRYTDTVIAIVLVSLFFGTNLYCYSAFEVGMSHPVSFLLFSAVLLVTDTIYSSPGRANSWLLGVLLGLIFIVRPVNIIVIIIPLLYKCASLADAVQRISVLLRNYGKILIGLAGFFMVAALQFAYWKYITGHWLYYAYQGEGFNFLRPSVIDGLFSYKKGWFIYTPMAVVCLWGLYYLWKSDRKQVAAIALFMSVMIYVVFSWGEWWYGGGYSCRPLIETLPVLAIPLCAITAHFYLFASKARRAAFITVLSFFIVLNVFQTYQYSTGMLHWSDMDRKAYWEIFGKIDRPVH